MHSAKNPTIPLLILQDDFWGCKEQYHKYSNGFSHAFMEPSCNITFVETKRGSASLGMSPERYHQLAIYLPYIHWSDNKQQKAEAKALEAFHLAPESLKEEYEQSKKDPRTRLQSFALLDSGKHRHHPRRTLDQYYYRHGTDTKSRDSDQIVLHGTGGQKLLMVDQLWVFVTSPDTIFTFFPKNNPPKGAADLQDIDTDVTNSETAVNFEFADLQKCMQESLSGNKSKMKALFPNAFAMAANCLYFSVKVLMSKTDHDGFSVMQSFQEAMAVTKEEAVKLLDAFILNPRAADVNIDEELKLLRKAADLEDELGIIHHLFHEQLRVVKSFIHQIKRMDSITPNLGLRKAQSIARDTQDILKEYLNGIEQQQVVARDTWGFILHCIDLKQTGASLQEARVTRRIAITSQEEQKTNSKQSRTMMIFTVFTVVFLPLGFFTSLYGMNIKEWSGEETNISGKTAMLYMVLISAFIISIALTVAFRFNELRGFIFGQRPPARSPRDPEPGMGEERRGRHGDHEMAPLHERRDLRGGGLEV